MLIVSQPVNAVRSFQSVKQFVGESKSNDCGICFMWFYCYRVQNNMDQKQSKILHETLRVKVEIFGFLLLFFFHLKQSTNTKHTGTEC